MGKQTWSIRTMKRESSLKSEIPTVMARRELGGTEQSQKDTCASFLWMPPGGRAMETGSALEVSRGRRRSVWWHRVSVWDEENVLGMDGGDGCTIR